MEPEKYFFMNGKLCYCEDYNPHALFNYFYFPETGERLLVYEYKNNLRKISKERYLKELMKIKLQKW